MYHLFNNKANLYAESRPGYTQSVMDYMTEVLKLQPHHIGVDLGAGTGQLTKNLANYFHIIYALEPNREMIKICKKELSSYTNIKYKCMTAQKTDFKNAELDFITVGQAFHLINSSSTIEELKRILKTNGQIMIVYNMKDHSSPHFLENETVLKQFCPLYSRDFHATDFTQSTFENIFTPNTYNFVAIYNDFIETIDRETFIKRTLSASYSITSNNKNYDKYVNELIKTFDKHAVNNKLIINYSTIIYSGKLR